PRGSEDGLLVADRHLAPDQEVRQLAELPELLDLTPPCRTDLVDRTLPRGIRSFSQRRSRVIAESLHITNHSVAASVHHRRLQCHFIHADRVYHSGNADDLIATLVEPYRRNSPE